MIDSRVSSQFIDLDFALGLNLALDKKTTPEDLVLADGVRSKVRQIMYTCTLKLMIDEYLETLTFHVTKLAGWNLIVGKPWLKRHNPTINWTMNSVTFTSGFCHAHCLPTRTKTPPENIPETLPKFGIALISHAALRVAVRRPSAECYIIAMMAIVAPIDKTSPVAKLVPPEYHDYLSTFSETEAYALPPRHYVDNTIPLVDGGKPPFGHMYSMSDAELKELKQWIKDNLSKSFMYTSTSSAASPWIIVRKPSSAPCICIDYHTLNDITIKDRHPLPCIEEALNQVRGAKYYTKIDLHQYFNQIHIQEGDEWKTVFRSR